MFKLLRIVELEKVNTVLSKMEIICLVYSLTSGGQNRVIPLEDKIVSCIDVGTLTLSSTVESLKKEISYNFAENNLPLNICFILGFFLGDGSLYIRIRDKVSGLVFIPKFEIKQKNTPSSLHLVNMITRFFLEKGVQASIQSDKNYVISFVEGIDNVCHKLLPLLEEHKELFFWKARQLTMTNMFGKLISLDTRNLLTVKYLLIKTIYSIENNRNYPIGHWIKRIDEIFKNKSAKNVSGEFYITSVKDKHDKTIQNGWSVYLPEFLNATPRNKYFYFEKSGGKDKALLAAVAWRDLIIDNWLKDNGYEIDPIIEKDS